MTPLASFFFTFAVAVAVRGMAPIATADRASLSPPTPTPSPPLAGAFTGVRVSGQGDTDYLSLLDAAARQHTTTDAELQTVVQLYRGDWDGVMEGTGWGAWWTQNSYGPTFSALPIMGDVEWAATAQSQAWWFNSIGNGTSVGLTHEGPAPDGCLCDAATPCATNECCWFKQGDGDVPRHDWTIEESLSAVVMQAEMLLVARNKTGAAHFLPLFLRTAAMLEARRDPATHNTTCLTGPGTNLLAPSFGGGPNGTKAYLAGVSVTYTAALNRMIELCLLTGDTALVPELTRRRDLNLAGIAGTFVTTAGSPAAGKRYLVRSVDPGTGLRHGVVGQAQHGYYEASPNHDAVALRVVDDALAEEFMSVIDAFGTKIRPHSFILPNTDALGLDPGDPNAVGYDDMLCGTGKKCGGMWEWGQWVNGGVWSTQEARAILAYYRTGRQHLAAESFRFMLEQYSSTWRMDAPLTNFGTRTWKPESVPTILTIDAFGVGAALLRGLFEYLYAAETLTIVPHVPDNVTALEQRFPVRWGAYRLLISTSGVCSSGVSAVTVGGRSLAPSEFNATAVVLSYAAMPAPSAAAAAATDSDVSTAGDTVAIVITFKASGATGGGGVTGGAKSKSNDDGGVDIRTSGQADVAKAGAGSERVSAVALPTDAVLSLSASDLASLPVGAPVKQWKSTPASGASAVLVPPPGAATPVVAVDAKGRRAVAFDGKTAALAATLPLSAAVTVIAAIHDEGTPVMFASVVHLGPSDYGLAVSPTGCSGGNPSGPRPCVANSTRVVAIDWSGSGDAGWRNVTDRAVVASVRYDGLGAASSAVGGCSEQEPAGANTTVPAAAPSSSVAVGSRCDGLGRVFKGLVFEVEVYNRTLPDEEHASAVAAMQARVGFDAWNCSARPDPQVDCAAVRATCAGGFPRKCGLNATERSVVVLFLRGAGASPALNASVPAAMARASLDYDAAFEARCDGLNSGALQRLQSKTRDMASLTDLLSTSGNLYAGLANVMGPAGRFGLSKDATAAALVSLWRRALLTFKLVEGY